MIHMVTIARVVESLSERIRNPGKPISFSIFSQRVPRADLAARQAHSPTTIVDEALNTGGGYTLAVTYVGGAASSFPQTPA